jgi:3-phosphoshikimate 1-carboxyvinyltransferase
VEIEGELISKRYVDLTLNLMERFGVAVRRDGWRSCELRGGEGYVSPGEVAVEGDASSASYFLAAGALGGGPVRVEGVGRDSIQGDIAFADVLAQQGAQIRFGDDWIEASRGEALRGGTIDCMMIPDAAMTLAIVALFAQAPMRLVNIGSWRVKETDRIAAMATELAKLGTTLTAGNDWLEVSPLRHFRHAAIDTYDDHRMAMCFALVALGGAGVTINDPGCVRKTYPGYFDALRSIAR